jgi:hypothetical protein
MELLIVIAIGLAVGFFLRPIVAKKKLAKATSDETHFAKFKQSRDMKKFLADKNLEGKITDIQSFNNYSGDYLAWDRGRSVKILVIVLCIFAALAIFAIIRASSL